MATLDFEELRHPSMCLTKDFIPNDVKLGGDAARTVLLTGPNMAGKSVSSGQMANTGARLISRFLSPFRHFSA